MTEYHTAESVPEWVTKHYPGMAPVLPSMAMMLRQHAQLDNGAEFELRLGTAGADGGFKPTVAFQTCDDFIRMCGTQGDTHADASSDLVFSQWSAFTDYSYRLDDGRLVRSRVVYDADTCLLQSLAIVKKRICRRSISAGKWIVRCDSSAETKITSSQLPAIVDPEHVCIAQRCSAIAPCSRGGPLWRYDITMRWDASTRSEAERLQRDSEHSPDYTVELEYIGSAVDIERHGAMYIACSGLLKILDIVNATSTSCEIKH
jgi:hypothetical protein